MTEESQGQQGRVQDEAGPEAAAQDEGAEDADGSGALLDPETGDRLEAADREKPIPGGEPACPRCSTRMIRRVEKYPAPRGGSSPFRVRLVCPSAECGAWTVYDW